MRDRRPWLSLRFSRATKTRVHQTKRDLGVIRRVIHADDYFKNTYIAV
jgi:hypothetical protein